MSRPRTLPLRLAAGGVAAVLGLAGCAGTDAKQAQDAAARTTGTGNDATTASSAGSGQGNGTGAGQATTPSSGAPSSEETAAGAPDELPMRDDGTIDPAKFEKLVNRHPVRTQIERQEVFQDDVDEPVSVFEHVTFIDHGNFSYSTTSQIGADGTRTPVEYIEYEFGTSTSTYWMYDDGKWGEKQTMNNDMQEYSGQNLQHMTKVEPDGPDGLEQRRFHIEYEPMPEELGGKKASVLEAIVTYDENWDQQKMRIDEDDVDYHTILTISERDEPVEFPKLPEGAHLKPTDDVSIRG